MWGYMFTLTVVVPLDMALNLSRVIVPLHVLPWGIGMLNVRRIVPLDTCVTVMTVPGIVPVVVNVPNACSAMSWSWSLAGSKVMVMLLPAKLRTLLAVSAILAS